MIIIIKGASDNGVVVGLGGGVLAAQSCPTLCNPMDCSLPVPSVHEILQTRILAWVAIPFSRSDIY